MSLAKSFRCYFNRSLRYKAEVYEFEGMDDLIRFRKKFPEQMKYEYHYILSGGTKNFQHIALVEANHFKQFKKLVNQYQDR